MKSFLSFSLVVFTIFTSEISAFAATAQVNAVGQFSLGMGTAGSPNTSLILPSGSFVPSATGKGVPYMVYSNNTNNASVVTSTFLAWSKQGGTSAGGNWIVKSGNIATCTQIYSDGGSSANLVFELGYTTTTNFVTPVAAGSPPAGSVCYSHNGGACASGTQDGLVFFAAANTTINGIWQFDAGPTARGGANADIAPFVHPLVGGVTQHLSMICVDQ